MGTTAVKNVTVTVTEGVSKPMDGVQTARRDFGALQPVTIVVLPDVLMLPVIVTMDTVPASRDSMGTTAVKNVTVTVKEGVTKPMDGVQTASEAFGAPASVDGTALPTALVIPVSAAMVIVPHAKETLLETNAQPASRDSMGTTAVNHVTVTVKEGVSKPMDGVQTASRDFGALQPVTIVVLPDVLMLPVIVTMDTVHAKETLLETNAQPASRDSMGTIAVKHVTVTVKEGVAKPMDGVQTASRDFGAHRPVTKIVLPDVLVIHVNVTMEAVMSAMTDSMEMIAARDVMHNVKMDAAKIMDTVLPVMMECTGRCVTRHAPQDVHAVTRPLVTVRPVTVTATWCSLNVQIVRMAITGKPQLPASSARGGVTTAHRVTRPPVIVTGVHLGKRGNCVTETSRSRNLLSCLLLLARLLVLLSSLSLLLRLSVSSLSDVANGSTSLALQRERQQSYTATQRQRT
ncbi:uncharacterized protein [Littorina saxatilis]|uniref:uncharacterized protein isoform X1 n=1 Tax=Littorina saxatilis TaxID=31220 RepID=UPI0038B6916F